MTHEFIITCPASVGMVSDFAVAQAGMGEPANKTLLSLLSHPNEFGALLPPPAEPVGTPLIGLVKDLRCFRKQERVSACQTNQVSAWK